MGIFITVNITDFLNGSGHFIISSQIIEKHKAAVEVNAFQNIVGNNSFHQSISAFILLKFIIKITDKFISGKEMLILLPLVKNLITFLRLTNCVQHIAVALTVYGLLKGLDRKTEVYFVGSNIITDIGKVGSLDTVQEDQEGQDLIIGSSFGRQKIFIILYISSQIDFFRNPEVIHGLTVPFAYPGIFHIIKIIQIGSISAHHSADKNLCITIRIKERLFC